MTLNASKAVILINWLMTIRKNCKVSRQISTCLLNPSASSKIAIGRRSEIWRIVLKTPLAVISGILPDISPATNHKNDADSKLDSVEEQLERMNQIVSYQLQRAVQSNRTSTLARHANISAAVEKVVTALQKVYVDKAIKVDSKLNRASYFSGDERDLLELLGNVLDNAFKYGKSRIKVEVSSLANKKNQRVLIRIEDDGEGISENQIEYVLQRGARADTLAQGQGIGLAVVTDIVNSYDGEIRVEQSSLGGAAIEIEFP